MGLEEVGVEDAKCSNDVANDMKVFSIGKKEYQRDDVKFSAFGKVILFIFKRLFFYIQRLSQTTREI